MRLAFLFFLTLYDTLIETINLFIHSYVHLKTFIPDFV